MASISIEVVNSGVGSAEVGISGELESGTEVGTDCRTDEEVEEADEADEGTDRGMDERACSASFLHGEDTVSTDGTDSMGADSISGTDGTFSGTDGTDSVFADTDETDSLVGAEVSLTWMVTGSRLRSKNPHTPSSYTTRCLPTRGQT